MAEGREVDDPTIPDHEELWRRIPPDRIVEDANRGGRRPSSGAFTDDRDGSPMSVVIGSAAAGAETVLAGHPGYALAAITAGLARECGQMIMRDPTSDQPAHALVIGHKTEGIRRRLARESRWIIEPDQPS
jgi:hypothetical protein